MKIAYDKAGGDSAEWIKLAEAEMASGETDEIVWMGAVLALQLKSEDKEPARLWREAQCAAMYMALELAKIRREQEPSPDLPGPPSLT